MSVISNFIKYFNPKNIFKELTSGWTINEAILLLVLIILQIGAWLLGGSNTGDYFGFNLAKGSGNGFALLTGLFNILTVVLVAKGKITNYFWGLLYSLFYLPLSLNSHLYGESLLAVFYVVMQFVGVYAWLRAMNNKEVRADQDLVETKYLKTNQWLYVVIGFIILIGVAGIILREAGSRQPYAEGINTALVATSQILQTLKFAESWYGWLLVNIWSIVVWFRAWKNHGDPSSWAMMGMNIALLINSIYGIIQWRRLSDGKDE
jgi:nicotinamide mononucleotide transporter